jgi:ribonuclease P protein component
VVAVAEPPDGQRRLATIVSRRYSRLAVVRNRARRLLRESYRLLLPEIRPVWLVLIPRCALQDAKLTDVMPEIRESLASLGALTTEADAKGASPAEKKKGNRPSARTQ